jgi:hypothetical protein
MSASVRFQFTSLIHIASFAIACVCVLVGAPGLASAQEQPMRSALDLGPSQATYPAAVGYAGAQAADQGNHAWFAVPTDAGAWIVHVPPRGPTGSVGVADAGDVRVAAQVYSMPEGLAAWERTLHMVFAAERDAQGRRVRKVLSMRVRPGESPGMWRNVDLDGRLDPAPSLMDADELLGFVGSDRGPVALVRRNAAMWLGVLDGGRWRSISLPPEIESASMGGSSHWLASSPLGPAIVQRRGTDVVLWHAKWPGAEPSKLAPETASATLDTPIACSWTSQLAAVGDWLQTSRESWWFLTPQHEWLAVARVAQDDGSSSAERDLAQVWSVRFADQQPTVDRMHSTPVPRESPLASAITMNPRRAMLLWLDDQPAAALPPRSVGQTGKFHLHEVSTDSGRVWYSGLMNQRSAVTGADMRTLMAFLFGVTMLVLLFVLKPTGTVPPLALPPGVALASPQARWMAGLIDLVPALLMAFRFSGIWSGDGIQWSALVSGGWLLPILALTLLFGAAHCAVTEWLFAKSLGKALMGCEVVSSRFEKHAAADGSVHLVPRVRRIRLWQAVVRNLIRWVVPPIGMEAWGDGSGRHRGDLIARTVVVERTVNAQK